MKTLKDLKVGDKVVRYRCDSKFPCYTVLTIKRITPKGCIDVGMSFLFNPNGSERVKRDYPMYAIKPHEEQQGE